MSISKPQVVIVEARTLRVHPTAQRRFVPMRYRKIMSNFDPQAVGVLTGVETMRNGERGIDIIAGQHRLRAILDLGLGHTKVAVEIKPEASDPARASELFLKLDDFSPVAPFDKYENEIHARVPAAIGMRETAIRHGLEVSRTSGDGKIACVSSMRRVFDHDSGVTLDKTLGIITEAWGTQAAGVEGKIVEGLGLLLHSAGIGAIDEAVLIQKLAKYPGGPPGLLGSARGLVALRGGSLVRAVAEVVIELYNRGRRIGQLARSGPGEILLDRGRL